jgi:hypothetical protein
MEGAMLSKLTLFNKIGLFVCLLIVIACGGSGESTATNFPLNRSFQIHATNNDPSAEAVHLWMQPDVIGPANRVPTGTTEIYAGPTLTWDNESETRILTFHAGRSGSTIATTTMAVTGQQAHDHNRIDLVYSAAGTLTASMH